MIKRFSDSGIRCVVNIDPILPLITDSSGEIELIVDTCLRSGVRYNFGDTLRLRSDIWERMKIVFKLLNNKEKEFIDEYIRLYHFKDPMRQGYNLHVDKTYADTMLKNLEDKVVEKGISFGFPKLDGKRQMAKGKLNGRDQGQLTLMKFM